jgi:membrane protein implicated in regulation of membrane protease activity
VGNWVNWVLVIVGVICVIIELALGALTGFDMALVGASLAVGGGVGLATGSAKIGLMSGGALALVYLVVLRSWLKVRLTVKEHASNVDAVVGRTGVVTKRIALREAGMVKLGDELWRAELASGEEAARETGATVKVESLEGVTVKVR